MIKQIKKGGEIMPRGNGMGPNGMGPMTGRGVGRCAGYANPGYMNGLGLGYGRGRGYGRMYYACDLYQRPYFTVMNAEMPYTSSIDEKEVLANHAKALESQLMDIKNRLADLENK